MNMKALIIETTTDDRVKNYWVAVDDKDVVWKGHAKDLIDVSVGQHRIIYWAIGTPRGKLTIKATVAGKTVFERKSEIPRDGDVANSARIILA